MTEYQLRLPWTRPPMSANDRRHWRAEAKLKKDVRATVRMLVGMQQFTRTPWPVLADHIDVHLDYWPKDRRTRDPDNLVVPFFKAICDGLVDAAVVEDDSPRYVTRHMPTIHEPDGAPRIVLTVRHDENGNH